GAPASLDQVVVFPVHAAVMRQDHPLAFVRKRGHPHFVRRIGWPAITKVLDHVLVHEDRGEAARLPRRERVVEEESQAAGLARCFSNAIASRTDASEISYQRLISAWEFAVEADAMTRVATPSRTIGAPKLRAGSSSTLRSRPSGHQRSSSSSATS